MDYSLRAQSGIEALLMMLLPSHYHWLVLFFREAADNLWSWLPPFIAFYAFYRFMVYQISHKVATFKTEDILIRVIQDPTTSVGQIIATQAREIAQRYTHAAVTDVKQTLLDVEQKSATTAETIAGIENDISTISSTLRGRIHMPLRRAITEAVYAVAKTTISKATQESINKLALRPMHWKDSDLREVQRAVYGHERWLRSHDELRIEYGRLNTTVIEQAQTIETLIETINTFATSHPPVQIKQDETLTSLGNKVETLTAAHSAIQTKQAGIITSLTNKIDRLTAAHSGTHSSANTDDTETITLLANRIDSLTAVHSYNEMKQTNAITSLSNKIDTHTTANAGIQSRQAETIASLTKKIDILTAAVQAKQNETVTSLTNRASALTTTHTLAQADQTETINLLVDKINNLTTSHSTSQTKQAEIVTLLTNKIDAVTASHLPAQADQAETIAALSSKIDTLTAAYSIAQEEQAKGFVTLTNNVNALNAAHSASEAESTKAITSLVAKANTLTTEQATIAEKLTHLPEIIASIARLQSAQEVVVDLHGQSNTSTSAISEMISQLQNLGMELKTIHESTVALGNRTDSVEKIVERHHMTLKRFKDFPDEDAAVADRLGACEDRIQHVDRKINGVLDGLQRHKDRKINGVLDGLQRHKEGIEEHKEDLKVQEGAVEHLRLDVREHREELDKHQKWLREDQLDLKDLRADIKAILSGSRASSPIPPEMDAEFDEELLVGDERPESEVDAEGETDDEYEST